MWIFTEFGFFSIVAHRSKPGTLLVRGRVRADLVEFAERAGLTSADVFEDPQADYRYRLEVSATSVGALLTHELTEMKYDNFKAQVERTQGIEREQVYMGVWSHLRRFLR
jgi:hypothetical protein